MIIYKTTNLINGKIYIGKDSRDDINYLGSGIKLLGAIKKYGKDLFKKEILEVCTTLEHLNDQEIHWISKFNATDPLIGYNIAVGGTGGNTRAGYSQEDNIKYYKKLSDGVKNSERYRDSVNIRRGKKRPDHSIKMKALYAEGKIIPHNLGKLTPEEVRYKISKSNKGKEVTIKTRNKIAKTKYKSVNQYSLDNQFIKNFQSIKHASEALNVGRDSIYGCCTGKYKQGGGFIWQYA
jgi:group I intron endonuclease